MTAKLKPIPPFKEPEVALLSVFDKSKLIPIATRLRDCGIKKFISTGGTATALVKAGFEVTFVDDLVGKPLGGDLVKTLSREIAFGLLANPAEEEQQQQLTEHVISLVQVVYVDLYNIGGVSVANPVLEEIAIRQNTDIGGPTMLREGGKGRRIVFTNENAEETLSWMEAGYPDYENKIIELATHAELTATKHSGKVVELLSGGKIKMNIATRAKEDLCYGENGGQFAQLYKVGDGKDPLAFDKWRMVAEGMKDRSSTLVTDWSRTLRTLSVLSRAIMLNSRHFLAAVPAITVITKHNDACGAGVSFDTTSCGVHSAIRAIMGDPMAAFGGTVVTNVTVDEAFALSLKNYFSTTSRVFDQVCAATFTEGGIDSLVRTKTGKCRILSNPHVANASEYLHFDDSYKQYIRGGEIHTAYEWDKRIPRLDDEPYSKLNEKQKLNFLIAWSVCATSSSNTITLAAGGRIIANATKFPSRVAAVEWAIKMMKEAKLSEELISELVLVSDSFFPFKDAPEAIIAGGIKTVVGTNNLASNKKGFEEIRTLFEEKNVVFLTVPDAEGRIFYGHNG